MVESVRESPVLPRSSWTVSLRLVREMVLAYPTPSGYHRVPAIAALIGQVPVLLRVLNVVDSAVGSLSVFVKNH